jgi:hypothetical protein
MFTGFGRAQTIDTEMHPIGATKNSSEILRLRYRFATRSGDLPLESG